jgi:hypothetical protein
MGAANFFIGSGLRRVLTSATVGIDDQNGLSGRTVGKFKALPRRWRVLPGATASPMPEPAPPRPFAFADIHPGT